MCYVITRSAMEFEGAFFVDFFDDFFFFCF